MEFVDVDVEVAIVNAIPVRHRSVLIGGVDTANCRGNQ
jgi:hypothetical protein